MKKFIVFLVAFGLVFGFAATAAMADVDLYGSARFRTYWADKDSDYSATGFDDEDLDWRIGYLTRWGMNFKSGDITGKVELDARDDPGDWGNQGDGSSGLGDLRIRHMYGEWNFGSGKLLIGQTFNPCTVYLSGLGYFSGGLQKFGGMGLQYFRTSQIRLTFGNLKVAFMTPDTEINPTGFAVADTDTELPRIEARYTLKLEPVTIDFMGGYQTYDVVTAADVEESIDSYIAALYVQANFGAAYVKAIVDYAQNGAQYGLWSRDVVAQSAVWDGTTMQDTECLGYGGAIGFKVSDMITIEASYMKADAEDDLLGEDEAQAYGILCKITPAPGVVIQPEIIIDDREDRTTSAGVQSEQGDATIIGVFWMINFK
jgi:hypothetical protein